MHDGWIDQSTKQNKTRQNEDENQTNIMNTGIR